jgi:SAM-dependent methyltransferase
MPTTSKLYAEVFKDSAYNPAEPDKIELVGEWLGRNTFKTIVDIGCGRGNYIKALDYKITGVDPIGGDIKSDILGLEGRWDGLYCMDVLEHISPEELESNLKHLVTFSDNALLGIANHSDVWNGKELHLIQQPADWWLERLSRHYSEVALTRYGERFFVFECLV